jgi:putative DNA primase/helicase
MTEQIISMVHRCNETKTYPITFGEVVNTIRTGDHGIREKILRIRSRFEKELALTGDREKAKKAIGALKADLPGFLASGTFSKRDNASLVDYSGVLCVDLDTLGDRLTGLREVLKMMPFVGAVVLSPSGDGLKVFVKVIKDPARHEDSFRAIQKEFRNIDIEIDEKCKDLARICFFTYDPDLWVRMEGNEILPPLDPLPRGKPLQEYATGLHNLTIREQVGFSLLGELRPVPEKGGYFVNCPGVTFHTNKSGEKHTMLYLDNVPTLDCKHDSCGHVVEAFNRVLRSEIGKAEFKPQTFSPDGKAPEPGPAQETEDWFTKLQSSVVLATRADLGSLILKPRVPLLGGWLCASDYGIIFGPRGVAKTWFSLMIANAIAAGSALGEWNANNPGKVLFIDGEMPADMMRDRILGFGGSENITLLNHEILFERTQGIINVTRVKQQEALLKLCIEENFKLLVLDNLSVCAFGVKENDSFEWEQLHRWLLQFRRHGIAVILLHHAGKTGQIRGTTKREDAAAWVISLTDAKERSEDKEGSRFVSYFSKQSRNCMNTPAYEWHVVLKDSAVTVSWKHAHGADLVLQCIRDGVSECTMIAGEMGVSPATICRMAKKLQDDGLIEIRGRKYVLSLNEECQ